jgi:acetolactate decarboxylase
MPRYARWRDGARLARVLDERLITTLHVDALRRAGVHAEHEPHVLFQASTIASLLEGAYEGDLTFAELAEHGDLGLGTLNALDGEMIAVDGRFYRADLDGRVSEIDAGERTPFAVVTWFSPAIDVRVDAAGDAEAIIEPHAVASTAFAVRLDGSFSLVRARSVPRQSPPYRPLAEVAAEQKVFELADVSGTLAGFCFPDYAQGLEVTGYHLHFIDDDRARGGHVLDCRVRDGRLRIDPSSGWRVELPPGVELEGGHVDGEALRRIERG